MVWNAALVLVTALACFLGVREGVRRSLVSQMDTVLTVDVNEIALGVVDLHAAVARIRLAAKTAEITPFLDALNRKASGHQHNGWFVELLDDEGQRLWASEQTPNLPVPDHLREKPQSDSGFRIVERRQIAPSGGAVRVRVGAPMGFIDRETANIDRQAAPVVGFLLFAAPLVGYWLAGRAIRPLAAIIRTTDQLRPNRLEERLPLLQTGDELDKLSRTVNQFLDRIAAYLTQSNDLLANSAHELRTPLAAIRSSVEVALGGSRTPQEYQELLSEVIDECTSLERLVNQLLLLSESDSERLRARSEPLSLSRLVDRSIEMFSAAAEAGQIELQSHIEPQVEIVGFGQHLRQLLNNLLDNALKFTQPGGTVTVDLSRDADGTAVLRVKDTGCGIPAADLPHIFERFFRGDKARQRFEQKTGTGLGLSICQAIVAAHGGQILVESREGAGTTFMVRLPSSLDAKMTGPAADSRDLAETIPIIAASPHRFEHNPTNDANIGQWSTSTQD